MSSHNEKNSPLKAGQKSKAQGASGQSPTSSPVTTSTLMIPEPVQQSTDTLGMDSFTNADVQELE